MELVLALLRTRRWISFTLTAIVAIVAFGFLSNWQWERAHEEEQKSDAVAAATRTAPVPLTDLVQPGQALPAIEQWRAVTVTGTLDCDRGFLVRNRPLDTVNGFWVSCPLTTPDGAVVWVNRGWMPAPGPATREVPMPAGPTGTVEITGRLRPSQDGPPQPPSDLPAGQVTHLDTSVLTAIAGLNSPAFDPYVEATAIAPADRAGLKMLPLPPAESAQNYSYAGQWLLFAAVAVGGWFFFLRREAREDAQGAAQTSAEVPSPTR